MLNPGVYETVIGLEVHVHLKTRTKAFCGCSTGFGAEPNTQVCPVCLGFPGVLPVLNREALAFAAKVGLALHCTVQEYTRFDRKHYYYPDLPKNYQISQFDHPVSKDGYLDIPSDAGTKRIRIKRAHLEEDAGKLLHRADQSLVDLNRAGIALLEIVTEPDLRSPEEAYEYLTGLKAIIEYLDVSDCDMEKGSLRCDANISVRPRGAQELGTKTELKNMNSFRGVRDALAYESARQIELLESGGVVVQETRLWDVAAGRTAAMRTKEEAKDYRYFPEPDLPPFRLSADFVERVRAGLPELPEHKRLRFMAEFGIPHKEASILVASRRSAEFAECCIREYAAADKKPLVNWLLGPVLAEANQRGVDIAGLELSAGRLLELVGCVESGQISHLTAKGVLSEMLQTGRGAGEIVREKDLSQVSDAAALQESVEAVIREQGKSVLDYRSGKSNALMFLVGQVMRKSSGKANPKLVQEILRKRLDATAS